jgi:hypothetical protein
VPWHTSAGDEAQEDFGFAMMRAAFNNGYALGPQALKVLDSAPSNVLGQYIAKTGLVLSSAALRFPSSSSIRCRSANRELSSEGGRDSGNRGVRFRLALADLRNALFYGRILLEIVQAGAPAMSHSTSVSLDVKRTMVVAVRARTFGTTTLPVCEEFARNVVRNAEKLGFE